VGPEHGRAAGPARGRPPLRALSSCAGTWNGLTGPNPARRSRAACTSSATPGPVRPATKSGDLSVPRAGGRGAARGRAHDQQGSSGAVTGCCDRWGHGRAPGQIRRVWVRNRTTAAVRPAHSAPGIGTSPGRRFGEPGREQREAALVAADDAELLTGEPGQPLSRNTAGLQQVNEPVLARTRGDLPADTPDEIASELAGPAFHASTLPWFSRQPAGSVGSPRRPVPAGGARSPRSPRRSGGHLRCAWPQEAANMSLRSGCTLTQMAHHGARLHRRLASVVGLATQGASHGGPPARPVIPGDEPGPACGGGRDGAPRNRRLWRGAGLGPAREETLYRQTPEVPTYYSPPVSAATASGNVTVRPRVGRTRKHGDGRGHFRASGRLGRHHRRRGRPVRWLALDAWNGGNLPGSRSSPGREVPGHRLVWFPGAARRRPRERACSSWLAIAA
jgi:hypothetical protein